VRDVGENRHQDAAPKAAELADLPLTWHFVGQLQSNKARAVAQYARVIHSVDRPSLVTALARTDVPLDVFLEVNLTDDPGRGGVAPEQLLPLAETVLEHPSLTLRGVDVGRPAGGGAPCRLRPAPRARRARAHGRTGGDPALGGDVGRLRGGHRRGRDTPPHRYGNHG